MLKTQHQSFIGLDRILYLLIFLVAQSPMVYGKLKRKPTLRICTGSPQNNYYRIGLMVAKHMAQHANVKVIITKGSWENLGRIHASPPQCDAIIAQDDAYTIYIYEHPELLGIADRLSALYPEHLHLLCHKKIAANQLSALPESTKLLIGSYGSGTFITWSLIKRLNPKRYSAIRALEVSGNEALLKVADGVQAHCLLTVNALAQGIVARAHDQFGTQLKLLKITDSAFQRPVQQGGVNRPLYQAVHIHKNVYPQLLKDHLPTQQVNAVFFVHKDWRARFSTAAAHLIETLTTLSTEIRRSAD